MGIIIERIDIHGSEFSAVPNQVCLAVTLEVESPNLYPSLYGLFKDARSNRLSFGRDLFGKGDIHRQELHYMLLHYFL
jgi:hypothetical protein